jgi:hypothetical protein
METSFQKIVLIIAILFLTLFLVLIGLTLSSSTSSINWPPVVGNCPDYWVDLSGNGSQCLNSQSLGTCTAYKPTKNNQNTMNFNRPPFIGTNGNCAKYRWAKKCKLSWDGLTYGVQNPCIPPTTSRPAVS